MASNTEGRLSQFSEPHHLTKTTVWFELHDDRPAFFAGLWTRATAIRKIKEGQVTDDFFAFLTCEPNAQVGAVHPKAMPVVLTEPLEWEVWLNAPWAEAGKLQRPLKDSSLRLIPA
jgi:putative SOS response-associated peptidase YedK